VGKTYRRLANGEWVQPRFRGYKHACCDCGLVHRIDFHTALGGRRILMRFARDERATAAVRREMRKRKK
jgi:hypothetical protein